jgi:hypothetical protein
MASSVTTPLARMPFTTSARSRARWPALAEAMAIAAALPYCSSAQGSLQDNNTPARRSKVNFHSFRRWFATKPEEAGQRENVVAAVMGHSKNVGLTFGRYSKAELTVEAVKLPKTKPARAARALRKLSASALVIGSLMFLTPDYIAVWHREDVQSSGHLRRCIRCTTSFPGSAAIEGNFHSFRRCLRRDEGSGASARTSWSQSGAVARTLGYRLVSTPRRS